MPVTLRWRILKSTYCCWAQMEGRNTASEGERRAAAYISRHFQQPGLTPGNNGKFLMPFPVERDTIVNAVIEVNGQSFIWDKDFNVQMPSYSSTMLFANSVFIGEHAPDSSVKTYLSGRLAIVTGQSAFGYVYNQHPAAILYVRKRRGNQIKSEE